MRSTGSQSGSIARSGWFGLYPLQTMPGFSVAPYMQVSAGQTMTMWL